MRQAGSKVTRPSAPGSGSTRASALRLLAAYITLAERGEHLLGSLLAGAPPMQWVHYPKDDAIDQSSGYQWFYHSHSPEDRPGTQEHGHIHVFARRKLWSRRLASKAERAFAALTGHTDPSSSNTRHLITIGLDAKGVPISLFTVNSWVTGDLMLSAALTEELLLGMKLNTGYPHIEAVIEGVIALSAEELRATLVSRDASLATRPTAAVLQDQSLELLSETRLNLDSKLVRLCGER